MSHNSSYSQKKSFSLIKGKFSGYSGCVWSRYTRGRKGFVWKNQKGDVLSVLRDGRETESDFQTFFCDVVWELGEDSSQVAETFSGKLERAKSAGVGWIEEWGDGMWRIIVREKTEFSN